MNRVIPHPSSWFNYASRTKHSGWTVCTQPSSRLNRAFRTHHPGRTMRYTPIIPFKTVHSAPYYPGWIVRSEPIIPVKPCITQPSFLWKHAFCTHHTNKTVYCAPTIPVKKKTYNTMYKLLIKKHSHKQY